MSLSNLTFASWESKVLGVRVYKLTAFDVQGYAQAFRFAGETVRDALESDIAWISADVGRLPAYAIAALETSGFHVACQYHDWHGGMDRVYPVALSYVGRYPVRPIQPADSDAVAYLAARVYTTGRFMSDPFFPDEWGARLYGAWGRNSCNGYADVGLVQYTQYPDQGGGLNLVGYMTSLIGRGDPATARLDLLGIAPEYQGMGIGISLLSELIVQLKMRGVRRVTARTEVNNPAVNAFYKKLGFDLARTGLVLHWVNGKYGVPY